MYKRQVQKNPARQRGKSYYWRHREEILARLRRRYREDDQYREAVRERARRRYHEDEAYREATKRRSRDRYLRLKEQRLLTVRTARELGTLEGQAGPKRHGSG